MFKAVIRQYSLRNNRVPPINRILLQFSKRNGELQSTLTCHTLNLHELQQNENHYHYFIVTCKFLTCPVVLWLFLIALLSFHYSSRCQVEDTNWNWNQLSVLFFAKYLLKTRLIGMSLSNSIFRPLIIIRRKETWMRNEWSTTDMNRENSEGIF